MYKVIASCWQYLCVINFDDNGKFINMDYIRRGWYWGFSYWKDKYFVSEKHTDPPGHYPIHVMNQNFETLMQLNQNPQFGSNVHQIQCYNNKLYVVCAERENVLIYDLNDLRQPPHIWRPSFIKSGSYPNTLFFRNNIIFILCHNLGHNVSRVLCYNVNNLKFIGDYILHHMKCHNIFYMSGKMRYCASESQCIGTFDNSEIIQIPEGQFVRGVAMNNKFLFIGNSEKSERSLRWQGDGHIMVYDIEDYKLIEQADLLDCGQIHELRLINKEDLCHHTGENREY